MRFRGIMAIYLVIAYYRYCVPWSRRRGLMLWVTVLAFIALLVSCLSYGPQSSSELIEPSEQRTLYERTILKHLDDDPAQAIQLLDLYSRESNLFEEDELSHYLSQARANIISQYNDWVAAEKFAEALALYQSLETLQLLQQVQWSRDQLYLALIRQQIANDKMLPALFSLAQIDREELLATDELQQLLQVAQKHNHYQAVQRISGVLGKGSGDSAPALNLKEMLNGLVTVWVDRGYRIERGVGVPDRIVGSGFFIDAAGHILTNYHIVSSEVDSTYEGYSRLYLQLPSDLHLRLPARVVGYDPVFDVALLKAEWEPTYIFGLERRQSDIGYGSRIFALGSPIGLQSSITSGVVSSPSRKLLQIGEALQVDAPVNPGNSGGPLIDEQGELTGIVFAGIQEFYGINFAIPAYWVWKLIPQLYAGGKVEHAWLGASLFESSGKLEVQYVVPGGPADKLGIEKGSILLKIANNAPRTISEAHALLVERRPEALVRVEWSKNEVQQSGLVQLESRPTSPIEELLKTQNVEYLFAPLFGIDVQKTNRNLPPREYVIQRVYPGTTADQLDISQGDTFQLYEWNVDTERRLVSIQIVVKKRSNSFSDSGIQISSFLDQPHFI